MASIRFTNEKMRYDDPNLPLVLRNISFDIEPQEKIGKNVCSVFFNASIKIKLIFCFALLVKYCRQNRKWKINFGCLLVPFS